MFLSIRNFLLEHQDNQQWDLRIVLGRLALIDRDFVRLMTIPPSMLEPYLNRAGVVLVGEFVTLHDAAY